MTGIPKDGLELSFPDGDEFVPMTLVERSDVLRELRDSASCATISALTREFFRSWLTYLAGSFSEEQIRSSHDRVDVLVQAADFLADEEGLELASSELRSALFGVKLNSQWESSQVILQSQEYKSTKYKIEEQAISMIHGIMQLVENCNVMQVDAASILEKLTWDQQHMVCRTCCIPQLLSHISEQQHALAVAAAFGKGGRSDSLAIPLTDVRSTTQIMKALASKPQVTSLAFRPWLPETDVPSMFANLQRLHDLMFLDISGMYLTSVLCSGLCSFLPSMPSITSLQLAECGITDPKLVGLLPAICQLPDLQDLSLEKNKLWMLGALRLAAHFSQLTNLRRLNIAYTGMPEILEVMKFPTVTPDFLKSIPEESLRCPVRWIHQGMWIFCRCLKRLVNLEQLDISCPQFTLRHYLYNALCSVASQLPKCAKINHWSNHVIQPGPPARAGQRQQSSYKAELAKLSSDDADAFCMMHPSHLEATECSTMQHVFKVLPKSVSKLHVEVMLDSDTHKSTRGNVQSEVLAGIDVPTQVTSLSLTIHSLATGTTSFMAALSSLTDLRDLRVVCIEDTGMTETAVCLPDLKNLTALELIDDSDADRAACAPKDPPFCKYMVHVASALQQLPALVDLSLSLPHLEACEAEQLELALPKLQGLTRLSLTQPSVETLEALAPVLPNQALKALVVCTDRRGNIRPLLANAARLTGLKSCRMVAVDDLNQDLHDEMITLLTSITSVTELSLSVVPTNLLGPRPGLGWMVEDTAGLVTAARGLRELKSLSWQSSCWLPGMAALFQPLLPDSTWSQLTYLELSAFSQDLETDWGSLIPDVPGSMVCRALCACEQLAHLSVRCCALELEDVECLTTRTQFPCLRVLRLQRVSMKCSTAERLGHALNTMQLPCLEEFTLKLACSSTSLDRSCSTLCCFMQQLQELQLPSVQILHIATDPTDFDTGQLDSDSEDSGVTEPQTFTTGSTIAPLLRPSFRLRTLILTLPGILQEQVYEFLPTLGSLPALTGLQISVQMDDICAGMLQKHLQGHRALRRVTFAFSSMLDSCVDPLYEWLKSLPELEMVSIVAAVLMEEKVRKLCESVQNGSKPLANVRHIEVQSGTYLCM